MRLKNSTCLSVIMVSLLLTASALAADIPKLEYMRHTSPNMESLFRV